jgi:homoserine dehydrogenase
MDKVGIGITGPGTVGSGVGRRSVEQADEIKLATGRDVELRRDLEDPKGE